MITLTVEKCPCGDRGCRSYWVEPLWSYLQGAGCSEENARKIARAMAATYPTEYRFEETADG